MWGKMVTQLVRNFALPVRNFALPVRNFKNHDNSYLATRFHMIPNSFFRSKLHSGSTKLLHSDVL